MDLLEKTVSFPALASLDLCPEAWDALQRQGSLCAERCGTGVVYKLRFRLDGRQQSRYVGKKKAFVDQIERELAELQADTRLRRRLRPLVREARRRLRRTKCHVEPLLERAGRAFHGRAIRRRRHNGNRTYVVDKTIFNGEIVMDENDRDRTETDAMDQRPRKPAAAKNRHGRRDRRTQRVDDLTDQALQEADPLRAILRAATAQLFEMGFNLGDELQDSVSRRRDKPKVRRGASGEVSELMVVHRQITRYVQLDQQWSKEKASAKGGNMPLADADSTG
jgi:hypothetical protein